MFFFPYEHRIFLLMFLIPAMEFSFADTVSKDSRELFLHMYYKHTGFFLSRRTFRGIPLQ